jgi:hypothetical protein
MRPDSFFHKSENPQTFFVSDITSVLSSSGVAPTDIEDFNDNYAKDNVNVSTMTTQSFMSNLVKVEDTGSTNYLSNIRYAAGATFDSIFSPYSTNFGHSGYFSSFEIPTNKSEPNSLTLNPFNPNNELSLYYAPTGSDLWTHSLADTGAPTAAELAKENSPSGWLEYGHNISAAVVGTGIGEVGEYPYDLNFEKDFYGRKKVEVENIRSVGLRAPMVLTGWGFDIDGKPVPADTEDAEVFASGAFSNPSNWKSGPLDVRWDDERKVWAAGGGGGVKMLLFEIFDADECGVGCVNTEVVMVACGLSEAEVKVGDELIVSDAAGCFFNVDPVFLIGVKGFAIKMDGTSDCSYEEEDCHWVVISLCCSLGGCP